MSAAVASPASAAEPDLRVTSMELADFETVPALVTAAAFARTGTSGPSR